MITLLVGGHLRPIHVPAHSSTRSLGSGGRAPEVISLSQRHRTSDCGPMGDEGSASLGSHAVAAGSRRRVAVAAAPVNPGTVPGSNREDVEEFKDEPGDLHSGHALLHDFCMSIPYGMIIGVAGIISLCLKGFSTGLALIGAGVVTEMLASLSIKNWKRQQDSRLFTAGSAGIALATTVSMWQLTSSGLAAVASKTLAGISAALLLFLVYNVLAGGNPPRKPDGPEEEIVEQIPLSPEVS